ncbi:MAG: hypothetical protein RML45_04360 [Acetobacteraceae bacterium]|nr:hypothetical protein [Acetobacteraceae bacterium]
MTYPFLYGADLLAAFRRVANEFVSRARPRYRGIFPDEPDEAIVLGYLWARTVRCPHCEGLVPLSPNWRLAPDGTGVRLVPHLGRGPGDPARRCGFEIVREAAAQSRATVADGDGLCPFPDCGRVIPGEEIKSQAQAGRMGEQLFAVVYKRRVETRTKNGKRGKDRWERGFRAPRPEDDNAAEIAARLAEKLPEWEALDLVPTEELPEGVKTSEPIRYGMRRWRDLFSPRQLLCHGTGVEVYRELLAEYEAAGRLDDVTRAAFVYLALALDKMVDYNSRHEHVGGCRSRPWLNTFDRHDFSFKWSYAEMAPLIAGLGYDWVIGQVAKCIEELVELARPDAAQRHPLLPATAPPDPPPVTVTCTSADRLDHIADRSIDAVVIDPPYYDNVMYAELADFFYVWLKRTAGRVVPELFTRRLTDKENEAVANPAKFAGQKGAKALAARDYRERMARIFAECRRVLKPDGIMTLMFTHKATGAWDCADHRADGGGLRHHRLLAREHGGGRKPAHPRQGGSQQHHLSRLPPARSRGGRCADLLGGCGARGRPRRARAGGGVPTGRHRWGGPLSRLLRPRPRGVLAPLAAHARHAAQAGRGAAAAEAKRAARRGLGPLCGDTGRRARCRTPRGEALAPRAVEPRHRAGRTRPSHELLHPRLGHLQGARVSLRRRASAGARGGG